MRLTRRIVAIVLVLSLLFVLTACSYNKYKIIGTWNMEGDSTFTFNKDGTCRIVRADHNIDCTYSIDGDKLTMTYKGNTETLTIKTLTRSKLELSNNGKETVTLTR